MTRVTLTARARDAVVEHGATTYPYEGCGLLIGYLSSEGPRITRALPCPNVASQETRTHRFSIDPRAVLNVRRSLRGTQESVMGFFHSHPDVPAVPSATDMEYIRLWPETVWLIVPVHGGDAGEPRAWWLDDVDAPHATELRTEVLPARTAAMAICPE